MTWPLSDFYPKRRQRPGMGQQAVPAWSTTDSLLCRKRKPVLLPPSGEAAGDGSVQSTLRVSWCHCHPALRICGQLNPGGSTVTCKHKRPCVSCTEPETSWRPRVSVISFPTLRSQALVICREVRHTRAHWSRGVKGGALTSQTIDLT